LIPQAASSETFSREANGLLAIYYVLPAFSPMPLALNLARWQMRRREISWNALASSSEFNRLAVVSNRLAVEPDASAFRLIG